MAEREKYHLTVGQAIGASISGVLIGTGVAVPEYGPLIWAGGVVGLVGAEAVVSRIRSKQLNVQIDKWLKSDKLSEQQKLHIQKTYDFVKWMAP